MTLTHGHLLASSALAGWAAQPSLAIAQAGKAPEFKLKLGVNSERPAFGLSLELIQDDALAVGCLDRFSRRGAAQRETPGL